MFRQLYRPWFESFHGAFELLTRALLDGLTLRARGENLIDKAVKVVEGFVVEKAGHFFRVGWLLGLVSSEILF
jgi:hypothetical protein